MAKRSLEPGKLDVLKSVGDIIDADYRGPIAVLFNFSNKDIAIEKGERFCQIVFQWIANHPVLTDVDNFGEVKTYRGERSSGSANK